MKNNKKYSHILWDWNGTLFDDVDWCMQCMNTMLSARGMNTLPDRAAYHRAFCFPIIDYYQNVGFDFAREPFEVLAAEYIALYHAQDTGHCPLHPHALQVLQALTSKNIRQAVLSASEINNLRAQMRVFGIEPYFADILGLSDVYAKSKVAIGLDYIARNHVTAALLVGDTIHDAEVAQALGADCLLIASGHQSTEQLLACGVPVVDDITRVPDYIL